MSNGVRIIPPKPKMKKLSALGLLFQNTDMVFFEGEISAGKNFGVKNVKVGTTLTFKITKAVQLSDSKHMWIGPKE